MSKINLQRLRELSEGEPDSLPGLITFYLMTTTQHMTELQRALQFQNALEAARLAHSLAGANQMTGMDSLVVLLQSLEMLAKRGEFDQATVLFSELSREFASVCAGLRSVGIH